jgi:arsenate reductase (thioredoxin)
MKKCVLFLCEHNSCRSQMAEAFLRKYAGDRFEVFSAGLRPTEIHPLTYRVMNEVGIDLSGQHAKGVRQFFRNCPLSHAIIVCRIQEQDCPTIFPGVLQTLHWSFENPAEATGSEEERLEVFRTVRDHIDKRIQLWLEEEAES